MSESLYTVHELCRRELQEALVKRSLGPIDRPRRKLSKGLRVFLFVSILSCATLAPVWSCGPSFSSSMVLTGAEAITAPTASFSYELDHIARSLPEKQRASYRVHQYKVVDTKAADLGDLKIALADSTLSSNKQKEVLRAYETVRETLERYKDSRKARASLDLEALTLPDELPKEFGDYTRGAIAYHLGQHHRARAHWLAALSRPVLRGRAHLLRYRSTWAAYMIGRGWLADHRFDKAISWFRKARVMARDNKRHKDSLGLAVSSLGWEALAEVKSQRIDNALLLYFQQYLAKDPGALASLRFTVRDALAKKDPAINQQLIAKPLVRRIVTAYVLSQIDPDSLYSTLDNKVCKQWLAALEKLDQKDVFGADRLAWLAYSMGEWEWTERWLERSPKSSLALWLSAKNMMRLGRMEEAAKLLETVAKAFPKNEQWERLYGDDVNPYTQSMGELGMVRLARRQYVEALDALLRAERWFSAAYVAEQVLTLTELQTYVDQQKATKDPHQMRLRYLLARRLARAGSFKSAKTYLPKALAPILGQYHAAVLQGNNTKSAKQSRAASLWQAAVIARKQGMELFGTELEPDWAVCEGNYEFMPMADCRKEAIANFKAHKEEVTRRANHQLDRAKRFHYRYVAADHAWRAANLLPNDSNQKALILCRAGTWLKIRDAKAADRFYKALVGQCPNTTLGKAAAKRRWFPPVK